MIPDHADFSDMLARWARERPDATAITFGDTRRSWSQLAVRVQRVVSMHEAMKRARRLHVQTRQLAVASQVCNAAVASQECNATDRRHAI